MVTIKKRVVINHSKEGVCYKVVPWDVDNNVLMNTIGEIFSTKKILSCTSS